MKRGVFKRISAIFFAALMLICSLVPLYASAYDESKWKDAANEDCRTWRQMDTRWADYRMGSSSDSTMGDYGCLVIAMSMTIKMSGAMGDSFQPMDLVKYTQSVGGFSAGGGYNNYANVANFTSNKVVQIGSYGNLGSSITSSVLSGKTDIVSQIKALTDAGYYIILHVANKRHGGAAHHFVMCVGYDDQDLLISDGYPDGESAYFTPEGVSSRTPVYHLGDFYLTPQSYQVWQCTDKPFNQNNDYFNGKTGEDNAAGGIQVSDIMKQYGEEYWLEAEKCSQLTEYPLILPVASDLSISERDEVADWKQTLNHKEEDNQHGFLRAVVMLVGIIIIVYSTLLFLAFQFDRINNFIDVPLLYFLTFGKMMTISEDEQSTYNQADGKGAKMMKQKDICIASIVGIAIGVLLLSGKLFELISTLVTMIGKLLDKI